MREEWQPIPDFPGYEVSDHGNVRSYFKSMGNGHWTIADEPIRLLKPGRQYYGHLCVNLRRDGKTHYKRIHQLVALAFIGPCPSGMEMCHNDGNAANNHVNNLRYGTSQDNANDRVRHGRSTKGEKSANAKFTNDQARQVRQRYASGTCSTKELAAKHGVGPTTILSIVQGQTYRGAGGPITKRHSLPDNVIEAMRHDKLHGDTQADIARRYHVSEGYVSLIINNRRRVRRPNEQQG